MKYALITGLAVLLISCGEKLMEKPEDLIPKEKMINILKDMTILNSAKSTNISVFHDNKIEPTSFIFSEYGIDSLQFVTSDRYYASLPNEYEAMYIEIEKQLEAEEKEVTEAKRIKDSVELQVKLKNSPFKRTESTNTKDSLP
ncbi:MAG: DUF4296 domain-containing protein [Maribacter sp.]|nr:DUF4296 domain-containing protein [Maribacter sp.]MBT8315768.1 DUF4296 domain-containing protein [Maribacter sp.]